MRKFVNNLNVNNINYNTHNIDVMVQQKKASEYFR